MYPFEAESVGAAAICIHRSVFEQVPYPWWQHLYYESRRILCSEDHYFCWKARSCGVEVWADSQMPCSHFKEMDLLHINNMLVKTFNLGVEHQRQKQQKKEQIKPLEASDGKPLIFIP
jgi:hypothetical protein